MTEPVRCCVIGLGWMGSLHAAWLAGSPLGDLVGCCDPDPAARAKAPAGMSMLSIEAVLDDETIEAAIVATPPDTHREVVAPLLERGMHVLCEKPLARSLEDADAMLADAERATGRLAVGHLRRFDPRFVAVADAVADGRVGRPLQILGSCNCPREDAVRLAAATSLALESAVHDLDAIRWLAGPIERVHAEGVTVHPENGVDALSATVVTRSGAIGAIGHSWAMPDAVPLDWEFRFHVGGVNGLADIDGRSRGVTVLSERMSTMHPDVITWPQLHGVLGGALAIEDAHFVGWVRDGGEWPVTLEDARAAVAAGVAIDRSIAERRPVDLDELA